MWAGVTKSSHMRFQCKSGNVAFDGCPWETHLGQWRVASRWWSWPRTNLLIMRDPECTIRREKGRLREFSDPKPGKWRHYFRVFGILLILFSFQGQAHGFMGWCSFLCWYQNIFSFASNQWSCLRRLFCIIPAASASNEPRLLDADHKADIEFSFLSKSFSRKLKVLKNSHRLQHLSLRKSYPNAFISSMAKCYQNSTQQKHSAQKDVSVERWGISISLKIYVPHCYRIMLPYL